jgi:predicted aldo/keto reductase-like oxidoreductase
MSDIGRREAIMGAAVVAASCASTPSAVAPSPQAVALPDGPRKLGKTGADVDVVSLGGEGVLRTQGRSREAVAMILEALRLGVKYCDTAPAYASSQDYYGEAFRQAPGARDKVFLASKTHERSREGSLRLLDGSLKRLGTDRLDLWQLHDLRTTGDLDEIFGRGGAIEAVEAAKADKRVRFAGITGHHDPAILVEAMKRYAFDTVLCAMNPADPARMPFLTTVVPEARKRGMGIIGMKVLGAGRIVADRTAHPEELIRYAARYADTVIIGCASPAEVAQNLNIGRSTKPLADSEALALEQRFAPVSSRYDYFKA